MKLLVTEALLFDSRPIHPFHLFNVFTESGELVAADLTAPQLRDLADRRGADLEYVPPPE